MSTEAVQWALDLQHANPTHKLVLIGLANHANKNGGDCHPSIDRLETYTGLGRSTIIRAVRQMEALGILSTVKAHGKRTSYQLNVGLEVVPERHQSDQCQSGTSAVVELVPERSKVVPQTTESGAAAALKPSVTVKNQVKGEGRGSRLAPDWTLPPELWAWAAEQGLAGDAIEAEVHKFRDYWAGAPGQKGVKADWPATWRNWCRRVLEDERRRGPLKTPGRSALMDELLKVANEPAH